MTDAEATIDALAAGMLASHGENAAAIVRERIESSTLAGDTEGLRTWRRVAEKISARQAR